MSSFRKPPYLVPLPLFGWNRKAHVNKSAKEGQLSPFSGTVFCCSINHSFIHKVIQYLGTTCKVLCGGVARFRQNFKRVRIEGICTLSMIDSFTYKVICASIRNKTKDVFRAISNF